MNVFAVDFGVWLSEHKHARQFPVPDTVQYLSGADMCFTLNVCTSSYVIMFGQLRFTLIVSYTHDIIYQHIGKYEFHNNNLYY